jgi:hypothetical protein
MRTEMMKPRHASLRTFAESVDMVFPADLSLTFGLDSLCLRPFTRDFLEWAVLIEFAPARCRDDPVIGVASGGEDR